MPKYNPNITPMTVSEIANLPAMLHTSEASRLTRTTPKDIRMNAEKYGGRLVGGKWLFPTRKLLAQLGIED